MAASSAKSNAVATLRMTAASRAGFCCRPLDASKVDSCSITPSCIFGDWAGKDTAKSCIAESTTPVPNGFAVLLPEIA